MRRNLREKQADVGAAWRQLFGLGQQRRCLDGSLALQVRLRKSKEAIDIFRPFV